MVISIIKCLNNNVRLPVKATEFSQATAQHAAEVDVVIGQHAIALRTTEHKVDLIVLRLLLHQHYLHAIRQQHLADAVVQHLGLDNGAWNCGDVEVFHIDSVQLLLLYRLYLGQLLIAHLFHALAYGLHLLAPRHHGTVGQHHAYHHVASAGHPAEFLAQIVGSDGIPQVTVHQLPFHIGYNGVAVEEMGQAFLHMLCTA